MSLPLRMNLVDVVIKQLDVSSTYKDSDFREGRAVVRYSDPVTLRGQPNLGDVKFHMNVRDPSSTGDQDRTTGHIVFKLSYLNGLSITLKKGDVITSIAGVACHYPLRELRYESPWRGSFLLVYAVFEKRRSSM